MSAQSTSAFEPSPSASRAGAHTSSTPCAITVQPPEHISVVSMPSIQRRRAVRASLQVQTANVSAGHGGLVGSPSHALEGRLR
jgi:hypothetical protein